MSRKTVSKYVYCLRKETRVTTILCRQFFCPACGVWMTAQSTSKKNQIRMNQTDKQQSRMKKRKKTNNNNSAYIDGKRVVEHTSHGPQGMENHLSFAKTQPCVLPFVRSMYAAHSGCESPCTICTCKEKKEGKYGKENI